MYLPVHRQGTQSARGIPFLATDGVVISDRKSSFDEVPVSVLKGVLQAGCGQYR